MLLNNDIDAMNELDNIINSYYKKNGKRHIYLFLRSENKDWNTQYLHYLIDRKHVIRYGIGIDRGFVLGGVEIAIGPSYFSAHDFWSFENSKRFSLNCDEDTIKRNLALLDEFWGYKFN